MSQDSPGPTPPVASLTGRMRQGDEAAWRTFHGLYSSRLLRYLLVVSGGREDPSREALQGAMLRAVRHIRRFDSEDVLWSWLTVLARSALVDVDRKGRRYRSLLDRFLHRTPPPALGPQADGEADRRLAALLDTAVAALPPDDRELLEQKYYQRAPVRTIAGAVGASEKSVESRLVRIRRTLREAVLARLKHDDIR